MARGLKTIKDGNGNDVEVYTDICIECSTEMVFPKKEADEIEQVFPFIKAKLDAGTSCINCVKAKAQKDQVIDVFSKEEIEEIKNFITKNMKQK